MEANDQYDNTPICIVLDQFCATLIEFAISIKDPTYNMTERIKNKKVRSGNFDTYISTIEEFNTIMTSIINLLDRIVLSLKLLLIRKTAERLKVFINNLADFLKEIKTNDVFLKLNEAKLSLNKKHEKDIKTAKLLQSINLTIHKVCVIGIKVASMVIPGLSVAGEISTLIIENINVNNNDIEILENTNVKLDEVIHKLIDIKKQSSDLIHIASIDASRILQCLSDKNAGELVIISRNLETEYVHLSHLILNTRSEINLYKRRKKNLVISLFDSFTRC